MQMHKHMHMHVSKVKNQVMLTISANVLILNILCM